MLTCCLKVVFYPFLLRDLMYLFNCFFKAFFETLFQEGKMNRNLKTARTMSGKLGRLTPLSLRK